MSRPTRTAIAYLSATLIVIAGAQLSAFEQGTYFIYQLVEQSDAPTIEKRLAVDSQLFVKPKPTAVKRTTEVAERSEFEMNYDSLGTTTKSDFSTTPVTDTETQTTIGTSAFDIAPQEPISLFGN